MQPRSSSKNQNSFAAASAKRPQQAQETDIKSLASELIEKYSDPTFAQPITRVRGSQQSDKRVDGELNMQQAVKYDVAAHRASLMSSTRNSIPGDKLAGSASKIR